MPRNKTIKLYDPENEALDPDPLVIEEQTGFMYWAPAQWALFFGSVATFVAFIYNLVSGNPVGVPFAG